MIGETNDEKKPSKLTLLYIEKISSSSKYSNQCSSSNIKNHLAICETECKFKQKKKKIIDRKRRTDDNIRKKRT
jgi:hypothetical protein